MVVYVKNKSQLTSVDCSVKMRSMCFASTRGEEVVHRIQDYVAQHVAARSLPFTAGEMALDCISAALCSVIGDRQIDEKSVDLLVRKGHSEDASVLSRLRYVGGAVKRGGLYTDTTEGENSAKRRRVQLRRGAVKKRVSSLATKVRRLKHEFLKDCVYITLVIDEGNNYSKNCPVYVAVIACSPTFEWRIMYVGQANTSGKKDGRSLHQLVKKVFFDTGMEDIYKKIVSASTDGASVMRSSKDHAGLDCNGTKGTAFSSYLKADIKEDADFWHCLIHQLNLAVNDTLDAVEALKLYWIPFVSST